MDTTEQDVVVKAKTERILAFDLMRGFFLLVIMIDHIELFPNGWDFFTGKGRLWVSAAEGFFFLSGLLIGMIYKRRLQLGFKFIFKKMWQRALELYIVSAALTFIFLGWVELTNHTPIKDSLPGAIPWGQYVWQALTFRFTYGWADFLIHFAALMIIAPFIFYLLAKGRWWLAVLAMITMWYFRGDHFTLAWQIIFNSGIIIGYYWHQINHRWQRLELRQKLLIKRTTVAVAMVSFTASYASVYVLSLLYHLWGADMLPHWLQHVAYDWGNWNYDIWIYADKWAVGWLRFVLFFFWFAVLFWIFKRYSEQLNRFTHGVLELLGRNSLFVYIVHAFIVFILKMYVIPPITNPLQNFLITGLALAALIAATLAYKWLQARFFTKGRRKNLKLVLSQVFNR